MRNRTIRATIAISACALLAGCQSNPPDPTQQAWLTVSILVVCVMLAVGMIVLASWLTRAVEDKKRRGQIGSPPRRRIDDFAFADQAPLDALIRSLHARSGDVRAEVALELCRRLLRTSPEELFALDSRTRAHLYRALRLKDSRLAAAILDIVTRSGDTSALPHVQRLLAEIRGRSGPPDLSELAALCRDVLFIAREDPATRLLRPVDDGAGDALLRPVTGAGSSDPELLLRPGNGARD